MANITDSNFDWNAYIRSQGADPSGNNVEGDFFRNYAGALNPEVLAEIQNLTNYIGPESRSLLTQFITQMNDPGAIASQNAQYASGAYENAGNSGNLLAAQLRGQGYGSGAQEGALKGAYQGAQQNVNAFNTQQIDPQTKLNRLMASLQALQSGSTMPAFGAQTSLFGPLEQRHAANQSEVGSGSFLNGVLGTAGQIFGGGNPFASKPTGASTSLSGYVPQNNNLGYTSGNSGGLYG